MLPYPRRDWIHMLVSPRGSFSPGVLRRVLAFGLIAALTWVAHRCWSRFNLAVGPYEVGGAVIALILAFRTNTAYARFWEGRTLWGSIVNSSRNLARIVATHARDDETTHSRGFAEWVVVFAHASRRSLRGERDMPEIERLVPPERFAALSADAHPPLYAARELSARLAGLARAGALDPMMTAQAESEVINLMNCLGGCERILKTPTPLGYVLLLQRCLVLYLASLPLALVNSLGVATALVTMMVAYPALMIEAIGSELDNPFAHDPNDLPLTRICDTIERNLLGTSPQDLVMSSSEETTLED